MEATVEEVEATRGVTKARGGGQRHFWHFLPVIPHFWQVPNFLRCQKCQTFKKKSIDFMYNRQPGPSHPHLGMF